MVVVGDEAGAGLQEVKDVSDVAYMEKGPDRGTSNVEGSQPIPGASQNVLRRSSRVMFNMDVLKRLHKQWLDLMVVGV